MNRRKFLISATAVTGLPTVAFAMPLEYAEGLVAERLLAGETVFLDFKASWCSTCRAQERVIKALKADNPSYEEQITFIDIDWDLHGKSDLVRRLKIPRRSTLVVLKGDEELGRIVAGTGRGKIRELMDTALSAATA